MSEHTANRRQISHIYIPLTVRDLRANARVVVSKLIFRMDCISSLICGRLKTMDKFHQRYGNLKKKKSYNSDLFWITRGRVINGELYAQILQNLIYLYLFTDCSCFMKVSRQSSEKRRPIDLNF